MSKTISDDLYQLIKALSKSEKRFFKLYVAGLRHNDNKKFIRLFEIIDSCKEYDESKILKKEKSFSKKQFSNLKAHLYRQILKSLAIINADKTIDIRIHYMIGQAQLLYYKCLYQQCMKILERAKKIAEENDRTILLLEIIELKKTVMVHTVSTRNQERIKNTVDEANLIMDRVANINRFSNLSIQLTAFYMNIGFVRNEEDYSMVKEFFNESLPKYDEEKLSFHEKIYLYYCYTGYCFFIQDFKNGYKYAKLVVDLFEENPEVKIHRLEMYIKALNNLLVAQNKLVLYDEFVATQRKLIAIKRFPEDLLNENVNLNLFKAYYIHEINRHFMTGDFHSGTRIVSLLEKQLDEFLPKLDKHTVLIFYFKIACLYFGSSNFKKSLLWLNRIINTTGISDLRSDLHSFARIMSLICHYELGNTDLLEYTTRSTYRFLLGQNDLNMYQRYILKFLRQLNVITTERSLITKFIQLRDDLLLLEKHQYEKRPFLYFDIISWLDSKIKKQPVDEVIQAKYRKRLKVREEGIN